MPRKQLPYFRKFRPPEIFGLEHQYENYKYEITYVCTIIVHFSLTWKNLYAEIYTYSSIALRFYSVSKRHDATRCSAQRHIVNQPLLYCSPSFGCSSFSVHRGWSGCARPVRSIQTVQFTDSACVGICNVFTYVNLYGPQLHVRTQFGHV